MNTLCFWGEKWENGQILTKTKKAQQQQQHQKQIITRIRNLFWSEFYEIYQYRLAYFYKFQLRMTVIMQALQLRRTTYSIQSWQPSQFSLILDMLSICEDPFTIIWLTPPPPWALLIFDMNFYMIFKLRINFAVILLVNSYYS